MLLGMILAAVVLWCVCRGWPRRVEMGVASYYGGQFHGRTTASGERFDQRAMTAAHRTLALGTSVRVTNLDNGREVVVRINDRGPFVDGRIIDVSAGAAERLGMVEAGLARVRVTVVGGAPLASSGG
jgi:rare lipoprotein A